MSDVAQKLWGFCNTLRHDGISYSDYIEQLTYLLFLKMAEERGIDLSQCRFRDQDGKERIVRCDWTSLAEKSGEALSDHYVEALRALGRQPGLLGEIFKQAQSRFRNPVNLRQIVSLIDRIDWSALNVDV